jgi:hypothetical protein
LEYLGLHNKPKAEVHPGHKMTGPKEEEDVEQSRNNEIIKYSTQLHLVDHSYKIWHQTLLVRSLASVPSHPASPLDPDTIAFHLQ